MQVSIKKSAESSKNGQERAFVLVAEKDFKAGDEIYKVLCLSSLCVVFAHMYDFYSGIASYSRPGC